MRRTGGLIPQRVVVEGEEDVDEGGAEEAAGVEFEEQTGKSRPKSKNTEERYQVIAS